jgi:nitroimidazol reductase NimA-like FMN-containing flavoprotein (pyridoxamine 5'-phosphate oxidase superfamily)
MAGKNPAAELEPRFSSADATATPWAEAIQRLEGADVSWLATVRPDGRPHVTPVVFVWLDGALYFCTGEDERKAKNLARNSHVAITTGRNNLDEGLDLVVEGDAARVRDQATLQRVAERFSSKYDPAFQFTAVDGVLRGDEGNTALLYEVAPITAFGFGKGEAFSQTRWCF